MSDTITLEGIVTAYKVDAMRDHSEDSFAVYDAVELRVTAPPERAGALLTFFVEKPGPLDLIWKEQGAAICFELKPSELKPGRHLFLPAARNARKC